MIGEPTRADVYVVADAELENVRSFCPGQEHVPEARGENIGIRAIRNAVPKGG